MAYSEEEKSIILEANKLRQREEDTEDEVLNSRLPVFLSMLKIGDELFASCSQDVFGTIAGINKFTVDITVNNVVDLIALESGDVVNLVVPGNPKVLIKDIEIKWIHEFDKGDLYAEFDTVNGCGGCVRRFTIRRNGVPVSGKVAVLV